MALMYTLTRRTELNAYFYLANHRSLDLRLFEEAFLYVGESVSTSAVVGRDRRVELSAKQSGFF
jgi:hypothetical protein